MRKPGRVILLAIYMACISSAEAEMVWNEDIEPEFNIIITINQKISDGGSLDEIKVLLKTLSGYNVDYSKTTPTPLHEAVERGRGDVVSLLLKEGMDPNLKDAMGLTPLDVAKSKEIEDILSSKGAIRTTNGDALYYAIVSQNSYACMRQLESGVDPKIEKEGGKNFLHLCAKWKDAEAAVSAIRQFSKKGLDVNKLDDEGISPLDMASCNEIAEALAKLGGKHSGARQSALVAYQCGNRTRCLALIAKVSKGELKSVWAASLMQSAIRNTDGRIIEELLSRGLDPDTETSDGESGLFYSSARKEPILIELFLKYGANVNFSNKNGVTPLHKVADLSDRCVKILLTAGCDINAKDKRGETALHKVCWVPNPLEEQENIAKRLLAARIDKNSVNKDGKTALDICRELGNSNLVEILENFTPSLDKRPRF